MASNYLAQISFVGTAYHGSQIQKNAVSVQSVFQDAVCSLLGYLPDMKFCSRTDSGVHARRFYISFFFEHGAFFVVTFPAAGIAPRRGDVV